ncbi:MAG TPA: hypothetical protein VML96_13895, partial [Egibacteraceae bacterium]|nr:hypothetical protein [Egibacteraceae bacterium]
GSRASDWGSSLVSSRGTRPPRRRNRFAPTEASGPSDNVAMAAVALAIGSGGALSSLETTVLLTVDETMDALGSAKQIQYRAPGA